MEDNRHTQGYTRDPYFDADEEEREREQDHDQRRREEEDRDAQEVAQR